MRNRETISERLEESIAQVQRGEVYTPDEAASILDHSIASSGNRLMHFLVNAPDVPEDPETATTKVS